MRVWTTLLLWALPAIATAQGPAEPPRDSTTTSASTFSGVDRQLAVRPPRLETEVTSTAPSTSRCGSRRALLRASRATRRSTAAPPNARPRCWSGIRRPRCTSACARRRRPARCAPRSPTATASTPTTTSQFFLSTFSDGRQAFVFAVNPFGVQMDGALVEGVRNSGGGFGGSSRAAKTSICSPDFVFQSRGRLVDGGYEVEIRIPFKSLRYQSGAEQTWGLHVTRVSPRAASRRAGRRPPPGRVVPVAGRTASTACTDLRRGLVLDLNPVATARLDGARNAVGDQWDYDGSRPEFGANVRWGVTQTLTMNGTVNPDFSQVESDAGQFQFDPRQALFFPDKRPFFLDGIEQFATPNNLIYTRRIVAPLAAAKLTGGVEPRHERRVSVGRRRSRPPRRPATTIRCSTSCARSRTSAPGRRSRSSTPIGSTATAIESRRPAPTRGSCGRTSTACCCRRAASRTDSDATDTIARRCGRAPSTAPAGAYGAARHSRAASIPTSDAAVGLHQRAAASRQVNRNQSAHHLRQARAAALERWTSDVVVDGTWLYDEFMAGGPSQDRKLHFNQNLALRGGWRVGGSVLIETFGYDESSMRTTRWRVPAPTAACGSMPFPDAAAAQSRLRAVVRRCRRARGSTADGLILWGKDENFYEWSSADIVFANVGATWRPTDQLRVEGRYQLQSFQRRTDGSYVGIRRIPRLKVEYQMSRPVFVRVVGEQNSDFGRTTCATTRAPTCRSTSATPPAYTSGAATSTPSVPRRLAVLVSAHAGHGGVRRLRHEPRGARRAAATFGGRTADLRRLLRQDQLSFPPVGYRRRVRPRLTGRPGNRRSCDQRPSRDAPAHPDVHTSARRFDSRRSS